MCRHCKKFFARFRCSALTHGECDCPKCQGLCECVEDKIIHYEIELWQGFPVDDSE